MKRNPRQGAASGVLTLRAHSFTDLVKKQFPTVGKRARMPSDRPDLEAIRRLVELGLTVKTKARPTGRLRAALVADLAAEAIDSLSPEKRKALGLKAKTGKT